jgi:hypothetical protein
MLFQLMLHTLTIPLRHGLHVHGSEFSSVYYGTMARLASATLRFFSISIKIPFDFLISITNLSWAIELERHGNR